MNIEVIYTQSSDDGAWDIQVFLGGKPADFTLVSIDPGSGWEREDWDAHRAQAVEGLSDAAREAAEEAFGAADDSRYIEG